VDGRAAAWERDGGELVITPIRGLDARAEFVTRVRYHGVPEPLPDLGASGFIHTDDGALVVGEPRVASTWFPCNDHPRDAASFSIAVTVPDGLQVVSNGHLLGRQTRDGWTRWRWHASEPMAPYLAFLAIGHYAIDERRERGVRFLDAVDESLLVPAVVPVDGSSLAISGRADGSYKRITRMLAVPPSGALLTFAVNRDTEASWDYFFVEARPEGTDAWTTLPDLDGFATQDVGFCGLLFTHPFVEHYQSFDWTTYACLPAGSSGEWWAATGRSAGWETWRVDLSRFAGQAVEISLAYASDWVVQRDGVLVDAVVPSTGEGTTSFEGGDTGGWQVPGAPPEGTYNENDWFVGTVADLPPPFGLRARAVLARQGEFLAFLESLYGPYPFQDAGGVVHAVPTGFALENQTRPTYPGRGFRIDGTGLVIHELSHQWVGDLVRLDRWQHVWLNEGFATYTTWLWLERQGVVTADQIFDADYEAIPADDPFWSLVIGDPGPELLFDGAVYERGAMTLHQLRRTVGDEAFFTILREWTRVPGNGGRTATTEQFVSLAERVSGMPLGNLFQEWLFTAGKPALGPGQPALRRASRPAEAEAALRSLREPSDVRR